MAGRPTRGRCRSGILRVVSDHRAPSPVTASTSVSAALAAAPIVAHVVRAGFVESVHHGTAVVTAPDGSVELEIGDSSGPVFPRSSSKPLQALAMVRSGLGDRRSPPVARVREPLR